MLRQIIDDPHVGLQHIAPHVDNGDGCITLREAWPTELAAIEPRPIPYVDRL
jgi:hypothetical protein